MDQLIDSLRLERLKRRISQIDLAKKIGINPATLCRIERGDLKATDAQIRRIASGLGASIETVLGTVVGAEPGVIAKISENHKRLRIEIALEEIYASLTPVPKGTAIGNRNLSKPAATVVFYVSLDKLAGDGSRGAVEEEVSEREERYPRER